MVRVKIYCMRNVFRVPDQNRRGRMLPDQTRPNHCVHKISCKARHPLHPSYRLHACPYVESVTSIACITSISCVAWITSMASMKPGTLSHPLRQQIHHALCACMLPNIIRSNCLSLRCCTQSLACSLALCFPDHYYYVRLCASCAHMA